MGKDMHEARCHTCELFAEVEPPAVMVETPVLVAPEPRRLKIVAVDRRGGETVYVPTSNEVTVGRATENDLVLHGSSLSKRQARFVFEDGVVMPYDLKSACGTYVNGHKIRSSVVLCEDAVVHMGNFALRVVTE